MYVHRGTPSQITKRIIVWSELAWWIRAWVTVLPWTIRLPFVHIRMNIWGCFIYIYAFYESPLNLVCKLFQIRLWKVIPTTRVNELFSPYHIWIKLSVVLMTSKNATNVIRLLNRNCLVLSSFWNLFQKHICISLLPFLVLFLILLSVKSIIITLLIPEHFHIFFVLIRIYLA